MRLHDIVPFAMESLFCRDLSPRRILAAHAAPAFPLDSTRLSGTRSVEKGMFDNSVDGFSAGLSVRELLGGAWNSASSPGADGTFGGPPGIDNPEFIHANDTCSGTIHDVTGSAYGWASSNAYVATLASSTLHTVAVGAATGSTHVKLQFAHPPSCPNETWSPNQPVMDYNPN